jgi:hypothetical protein
MRIFEEKMDNVSHLEKEQGACNGHKTHSNALPGRSSRKERVFI